jgi:hypothetical protein
MNTIKEMKLFGSSDVGEIFANVDLADLEAKLDKEEAQEKRSLMWKTKDKNHIDYLSQD